MHIPRSSGILLHPTSLPGRFGIGDLGPGASRFIDFLAASGQAFWQILPLGPTGYGHSPYSSFSAFAGNPLLISPERLVDCGDLTAGDLAEYAGADGQVDYAYAAACRKTLLGRAWQRFATTGGVRREAFAQFCHEQGGWLNDFALFLALRARFGGQPWTAWPDQLRRREEDALEHWRVQLADDIALQNYIQFAFFEQWRSIKNYANSRGIHLFGDLPIFVAHDSSDTWSHQRLFHLDDNGAATLVAGVPPDYFSATGQRWGNPLYRWEVLAAEDFAWWQDRIRWNLELTDLLRIDHFRGFAACWEIPASEPTAIHGHWVPVPGAELFNSLQQNLGELPLVAEDLGIITPDVVALRERFGFPGMKILQFAFDGGSDNPYLPHNHVPDCVVYTGTHDNNTTLGWWRALDAPARQRIRDYLGHPCRQMPWDLIRVALASVASLAVIPLQDVLARPADQRMNTPGRPGGNWTWRTTEADLDQELAERLRSLTALYGRLPEAG